MPSEKRVTLLPLPPALLFWPPRPVANGATPGGLAKGGDPIPPGPAAGAGVAPRTGEEPNSFRGRVERWACGVVPASVAEAPEVEILPAAAEEVAEVPASVCPLVVPPPPK